MYIYLTEKLSLTSGLSTISKKKTIMTGAQHSRRIQTASTGVSEWTMTRATPAPQDDRLKISVVLPIFVQIYLFIGLVCMAYSFLKNSLTSFILPQV